MAVCQGATGSDPSGWEFEERIVEQHCRLLFQPHSLEFGL